MLDVATLKSLLTYDPETGFFHWRVDRKGMKAGDLAGAMSSCGYVRIKVCRKEYSAHRLAWLYMTGEWPAATIDHINGRRDDNRFGNLRPATIAQNSANLTGPAASRSGYRGVYVAGRRFQAMIKVAGKNRHLGLFDTAEEAARARDAVARQIHGEFASLNFPEAR